MPLRRRALVPEAEAYRNQAEVINSRVEKDRAITRFVMSDRHHELAQALMRADIDDARVNQVTSEMAIARMQNGWTERMREILTPTRGM